MISGVILPEAVYTYSDLGRKHTKYPKTCFFRDGCLVLPTKDVYEYVEVVENRWISENLFFRDSCHILPTEDVYKYVEVVENRWISENLFFSR